MSSKINYVLSYDFTQFSFIFLDSEVSSNSYKVSGRIDDDIEQIHKQLFVQNYDDLKLQGLIRNTDIEILHERNESFTLPSISENTEELFSTKKITTRDSSYSVDTTVELSDNSWYDNPLFKPAQRKLAQASLNESNI